MFGDSLKTLAVIGAHLLVAVFSTTAEANPCRQFRTATQLYCDALVVSGRTEVWTLQLPEPIQRVVFENLSSESTLEILSISAPRSLHSTALSQLRNLKGELRPNSAVIAQFPVKTTTSIRLQIRSLGQPAVLRVVSKP